MELSRRSVRQLSLAIPNSHSELKTKESWSEKGHAAKFDLSIAAVAARDTVERIRVDEVSPRGKTSVSHCDSGLVLKVTLFSKEFIEDFESKSKPVVILGAQEDWTANQKWTIEVNNRYLCKRVLLLLIGTCFSQL
jgi:hypothetical protein